MSAPDPSVPAAAPSAATLPSTTTHADAAADADDDEYTALGDIPAQVIRSTESDTIRFNVPGQDGPEGACSPDHDRGNLFSPTFLGGEVSYSKERPPVPAALRPLLGTDGGGDGCQPPFGEVAPPARLVAAATTASPADLIGS